MTLPPTVGAALSLLPCKVGVFNTTPRVREANRYAHAMPTPGIVWQVVGVPLKQMSFLASPVIPSTEPRTWKVLAQGRQLGVGGGTGEEQNPARVSEQVGELTY